MPARAVVAAAVVEEVDSAATAEVDSVVVEEVDLVAVDSAVGVGSAAVEDSLHYHCRSRLG